MLTALASIYTQRKVRKFLAMTGEITLRGQVLPVGGIKEKLLAARRAGIKEIVLCEANRKHVEDIQARYLKGLRFHYVKTMTEVVDRALLKEKWTPPSRSFQPHERPRVASLALRSCVDPAYRVGIGSVDCTPRRDGASTLGEARRVGGEHGRTAPCRNR